MQTKQLLLVMALVVVAVVAADLFVTPAESPETGPYLNAEPTTDTPDDAVMKEHNQLSPEQQDVFERAVSDDGGVRLDGANEISVWYETDFVRYDGQLYRILVAEV